jgi:hypothetical protein
LLLTHSRGHYQPLWANPYGHPFSRSASRSARVRRGQRRRYGALGFSRASQRVGTDALLSQIREVDTRVRAIPKDSIPPQSPVNIPRSPPLRKRRSPIRTGSRRTQPPSGTRAARRRRREATYRSTSRLTACCTAGPRRSHRTRPFPPRTSTPSPRRP